MELVFRFKKEILESEVENLFLTSSWIDHSKYVDIEKIRQSFVNIKFFIQNQENLQYYFQTLHIII